MCVAPVIALVGVQYSCAFGRSGREEVFVFVQEILHLGCHASRRPESIPDRIAHPCAVGNGHVAAIYRCFQQEDPVEVIRPAPVQQFQHRRDDPAIGILGDDHRLSFRKPGAVPVEIRLAEQCMLHLRNNDICLGHDGVVCRLKIEEISGNLDLPPISLKGVGLGVIDKLTEILPHLRHLVFPVVFEERRTVREGTPLFEQVFLIVEVLRVDTVPLRSQFVLPAFVCQIL